MKRSNLSFHFLEFKICQKRFLYGDFFSETISNKHSYSIVILNEILKMVIAISDRIILIYSLYRIVNGNVMKHASKFSIVFGFDGSLLLAENFVIREHVLHIFLQFFYFLFFSIIFLVHFLVPQPKYIKKNTFILHIHLLLSQVVFYSYCQ
jgi:hypothetical protein